jgi:hypothetical protein
MNGNHIKRPGPILLILQSAYLPLFVAWVFVQEVMVAPKYGRSTANMFGYHAITMVVITSLLNWAKDTVLRRFGKRVS